MGFSFVKREPSLKAKASLKSLTTYDGLKSTATKLVKPTALLRASIK